MSAIDIDGLRLTLAPEQFDALVDAVAARLAERAPSPSDNRGWLNVPAAAAYLACTSKRIYDLKGKGRLRYAKDGTRLLFRREWLDAVPETHARFPRPMLAFRNLEEYDDGDNANGRAPRERPRPGTGG